MVTNRSELIETMVVDISMKAQCSDTHEAGLAREKLPLIGLKNESSGRSYWGLEEQHNGDGKGDFGGGGNSGLCTAVLKTLYPKWGDDQSGGSEHISPRRDE